MNDLPLNITIGDKYRPAMEIAEQAEADRYFGRLVEHSLAWFEKDPSTFTDFAHEGETKIEASERLERVNRGYFAGYYDREIAQRVLTLFKAAHPIFGTTAPTDEEAIEAGYRLGMGEAAK